MMQQKLTVAEVLERAADLIEPEGAWTQGAFARDERGRSVGLSDLEGAACFCAVGATEAVSANDLTASCRADRFLARFLGVDSVSAWNDAPERTQAEVVAKLREAATLARGETA